MIEVLSNHGSKDGVVMDRDPDGSHFGFVSAIEPSTGLPPLRRI